MPAAPTYFCFCSLPSRDDAQFDELPVASAIVVDEALVSSPAHRDDKLLALPSGVTFFSSVITNKRYETYNTDERNVPHRMLLSLLLERVGFYQQQRKGAFNTFLPEDRKDDYALTLRQLTAGMPKEWDEYRSDKEIFRRINPGFMDATKEPLKRFFIAANKLSRLLHRKLENDLDPEEMKIWERALSMYYHDRSGGLAGFGIKLYPDEYLYRFL